ncbi:MAG TPA: nucleotidyltransferase family protein [Flavisolibacter sp.]|nr:nucleotidyltransferase family protein [Flavisolibacter sp.]
MKAMIFAAGLGTRFKPWTDKHPKALAIVNGKSLLQRNVEYLQQYGITDVVVNVHHFADQIENAVEKAGGWGSNITISDERGEVLETGGGLVKAKSLLQGETFLTLNVDILTDVNLKAMLVFHQQQGADVTLGVTGRTTSRYLLFNENNRLCGWRNVATGQERISIQQEQYLQKAYSGLAIFEPHILDAITQTGKFSLIDVYLSLAASHKIVGYDHSESRVLDVGKPESVAIAESMFP